MRRENNGKLEREKQKTPENRHFAFTISVDSLNFQMAH